MPGFRIEIVATIYRTAEFGSKKSIKSQFEYDLDRILAGGRLHRLSLQSIDVLLKNKTFLFLKVSTSNEVLCKCANYYFIQFDF